VLAGLCHSLNDRIAAVSAYLYLAERRKDVSDLMPVLQDQMERLVRSVRLVRSLVREETPSVEPVALSVLAESATELMEAYPGGAVVYRPRSGDEGAIIRCDWTRALRALVLAGAWVARESLASVEVEMSFEHDEATSVLVLAAPDSAPLAVSDPPLASEPGSEGITIVPRGPRRVEIRFVTRS
jgi:hypothetical protein